MLLSLHRKLSRGGGDAAVVVVVVGVRVLLLGGYVRNLQRYILVTGKLMLLGTRVCVCVCMCG